MTAKEGRPKVTIPPPTGQKDERTAGFRPNFAIFIRQSSYNPNVRGMAQDKAQPGIIVEQTEWLVIRASGIHGTGAFARKLIPRGTRVIEYQGERISKAESVERCEANNEYIFSLNESEDLDGNVPWNPARFINHSCRPNCEAELASDQVFINASQDIAEGDEVTFNYGYDLHEYHEYPCRCGAPECVGFIVAEEFFEHVRDAAARQTNPDSDSVSVKTPPGG